MKNIIIKSASILIGVIYTICLIVMTPIMIPVLAIVAILEQDLNAILSLAHEMYIECPVDYLSTRITNLW